MFFFKWEVINVSADGAAVHRPIHSLHHYGWGGQRHRQPRRRRRRADPVRLRGHPLDIRTQSARGRSTPRRHLLPLQEGNNLWSVSSAHCWLWVNSFIVLIVSRSQVSYLPFSEAFKRAEAENKLVHSILLWGALDDQSCWGEITPQHCTLLLWAEKILKSQG